MIIACINSSITAANLYTAACFVVIYETIYSVIFVETLYKCNICPELYIFYFPIYICIYM